MYHSRVERKNEKARTLNGQKAHPLAPLVNDLAEFWKLKLFIEPGKSRRMVGMNWHHKLIYVSFL